MDDEKTLAGVVTAHEDEAEALRLLVELLQSADADAVAVRIACDDGTIDEIEVGASAAERHEVLAVLRRRLSRIQH